MALAGACEKPGFSCAKYRPGINCGAGIVPPQQQHQQQRSITARGASMISKHVRGPVGSTAGRHRSRSRSDLPPAFSPEPLERRVFMDVSLTAETLVNA